jgi:hypothetical protein
MEQDNPICIRDEVVRTWEWRDRAGNLYHTNIKPERCRHGTLTLCRVDGEPYCDKCLLDDLAAMKQAEEDARMNITLWTDADGIARLDYRPKKGSHEHPI